MPQVAIRLLGGFGAEIDGVAVAGGVWRLKKARELVKLLALADGQRLHREQVMDALWRDLDPARAANNLNQAVHVARRALGAGAIEAREGLLLLAASVDVARFEEAAAAARGARTASGYRTALGYYGGELLPENRYDDFAERRREELADLREALTRELRSLEDAVPTLRLPVETSSFIGRTRELAELRALLRRCRLLTLAGTGGAGKTRLALELARGAQEAFAGGAALVELAPVAEAGLVADAVAAALDVQGLPGQTPVEAVGGFVAPRELLLVLDNCEHVLSSTAALVDALLRAAPRLTVLATSREPLRVPGEVVFRVPSLVIPDPEQVTALAELGRYEAVRLFVERAAAVAPGFELADRNAGDVARICFRLDGLPLALELAAGRVGGLSPAAIAERLDDRFRLLRSGSTVAPTRQQTLAATLRWSHDLLEPDERVLFRRLAVFAGGFDLGAAEAVCAGEDLGLTAVADVLGRLVEKSLVNADDRGRDRRYRLLETVRLYAQEQLRESAEAPRLLRQHAYWALALAEAAPETSALDREAANLRAALDTLEDVAPDDALRLCSLLMPFWLRRIDLVEAQRRFANALAASPAPTALRVEALLAASAVHFRSGTMPEGFARAEEGLATARAVGDVHAERRSLQRLAEFSVGWDDGAAALAHLDAALEISRRAELHAATAHGIYTRGAAHWLLDELDRAEEYLAESLELFRRLDEGERMPSPLNIAELRWDGVPGLIGPRIFFEETLQPFFDISSRAAVAHVLVNQAGLARIAGELEHARELSEESERLCAVPGEERSLAGSLVRRAYLELAEGDYAAARAALGHALELRRRLNDRRGIGMALAALGFVDAVRGDLATAASELAEARDLFRRAGDRWGFTSTLWRTADLELVRGEFGAAEQALEEAEQVLEPTQRLRWFGHTVAARAEVALARGDLALAAARLASARDLYLGARDADGVRAVDRRSAEVLKSR